MIKRCYKRLSLPETIGGHSFRATDVTMYLINGGTVEKVKQIVKCFTHNGTLWSDSKRESDQVTKGKVGCFSPRLICLRRCLA